MSCTIYREMMQEWFDTAGTPGMPDELRDHVRICTDCTQYIRQWNSLEVSLRSIRDDVPSMSYDFRSNLKAAIAERESRTIWRALRIHRNSIFAVSASAAAIAAIGMYVFSGLRHTINPSAESLATIHSPIPGTGTPKSQAPNQ